MKRKRVIKMVSGSLLTILIGVMSICVVLFFLGSYLFEIQVSERLRYVKDYNDFVLMVEPMENCSNEMVSLFQVDDVIFQGVCIQDIKIRYGRTEAPLKIVLERKYIGLKELEKKFQKVNTENQDMKYYENRRSEEKNGNYRVTVANRYYQNVTLKEVTFELYSFKEVQDVSVSGSADI